MLKLTLMALNWKILSIDVSMEQSGKEIANVINFFLEAALKRLITSFFSCDLAK